MGRRRYKFDLTCYIPTIGLIIALIFLYFGGSIRHYPDTQPVDGTNTKNDADLGVNPFNAIKFIKGKINSQLANEQEHAVHDNPEQIIAPNIDGKNADSIGPGEMGKAVDIDKTKLVSSELQKYEDGFQKNAFNEYASDLISKHRSLPDVRDSGCRKIQYKELLPTASIVICFHNEAWSVLLRSIHSIIDRSPSHLLKEIILVDDFSDMEHLKRPLNEYIRNLKIVSIIRQEKREGLIRSRLAGAAIVKGDVIIFLDSHIEVTEGWLQPLLDPISQNYTNVVTPIIDVIDDTTFKFNYGTVSSLNVGGFDWNLQFTWHALPEREQQRRKHHLEPVRTPTMPGGLFAISKQFFTDIGTYDDGMDIWGGENLEISFRIWMCGGTLLTTPCSHVGHIFRKRSPYKWLPGVNVVKKNSIRVAEVWLDEYRKFYYERFNYILGDYGDVTSRKILRQKLQCKSFKWYLTEIYPELFIPSDAIASGEIRSLRASYCIDGSTDNKNLNKPVIGFPCHHQGGNQFFMLSPAGEIRRDEGCLDYSGGTKDMDQDNAIVVLGCHGQKGHQEWVYNEDNQLYHPNSGLCLALSDDNEHIRMQACEAKNLRQRWLWKRKTNRVL